MNILQIIIAQVITLVSLMTACGVLLHDTHIDKAVSSVVYKTKLKSGELNSETAARPSSNLHPHAEHLSVKKDNSNLKAMPRKRNKSKITENRVGRGFHADGYCIPLAGDWL